MISNYNRHGKIEDEKENNWKFQTLIFPLKDPEKEAILW